MIKKFTLIFALLFSITALWLCFYSIQNKNAALFVLSNSPAMASTLGTVSKIADGCGNVWQSQNVAYSVGGHRGFFIVEYKIDGQERTFCELYLFADLKPDVDEIVQVFYNIEDPDIIVAHAPSTWLPYASVLLLMFMFFNIYVLVKELKK